MSPADAIAYCFFCTYSSQNCMLGPKSPQTVLPKPCHTYVLARQCLPQRGAPTPKPVSLTVVGLALSTTRAAPTLPSIRGGEVVAATEIGESRARPHRKRHNYDKLWCRPCNRSKRPPTSRRQACGFASGIPGAGWGIARKCHTFVERCGETL